MHADSLRMRKYVLNRAEIFMKKEIVKQLTVSTHSTRDKSGFFFFFFLRLKHLLVLQRQTLWQLLPMWESYDFH